VSDEAAWLQARVQAGDLDPDYLRMAAYLEHPAAAAALDEPAEAHDDLREWVLGIEPWGDEACVIAAIACGRVLRAAGRTGEAVPSEAGLAAAQRLVDSPSHEHEVEARKRWTDEAEWMYEVAWAEIAAEVAWDAVWASSEDRVRALIRERLVPWALEKRPLPSEADPDGDEQRDSDAEQGAAPAEPSAAGEAAPGDASVDAGGEEGGQAEEADPEQQPDQG